MKKIRAVIAYLMTIVLGVSTSADAGTNISFNGTTYTVPAVADASWGTNVSTYLIAIASGALQKSGGTFTLTQEVDFGGTYGLKAQYFKSKTSTISSTGILRLGNNGDSVSWRNAANGADLPLNVNGSDALQFNSISLADISTAQTLTNKTMSGSSNTFTNLPSTAITGTLGADHGGTGVANNSASTLTISGAYPTTFTVGGSTALTLPSSGTLASLDGTETFTNKTLTSPKLNENVAVTTTATKLNYLTSAGGTTGTTSTNIVFSTSPTLVTPTLGVATATSVNKVTITQPTSGATLTLVDGGSLITAGAYATTLTSTAATNVTLPTTGTLASLDGTETFTNKTLTSPKLNENVAVTTTATKLNYLTSAGGTTGTTSTNIVFSTSPTLVTPVLGVATATSVNGTTIPSSKTLVVTTDKLSVHAATSSSELAGVLSDETGSGLAMFATSPSITTSLKFNGTSSGTMTMAPASAITDYTITWPAAQGAASTVLTNDGAGALSWGAALTTTLSSQNTFVGNGSNVATAVDTSLLGYVTAKTSSQTYAVTSAAPGVFTVSGHGLVTGDKAYVTVTQNGFTANTTYYVHKIDANTFHLSTTLANSKVATYITSSGTTAGTIVSGGFNLAAGVPGTVTNDSATAGYVGEFISATFSGTSFGTTAQWADATSISLTPGDWDISYIAIATLNGATMTGNWSIAVTSTSGNSTTGQLAGDNRADFFVPTTAADFTGFIPGFRVTVPVGAAVTYYAKMKAGYTVATPQLTGRISARRVR